jgi:ADP-ribose pyrophosphatase YjhB (NUDIX family)
MPVRAASDGEEVPLHAGGQDWLLTWHGHDSVPEGKRHGAAAVCVPDKAQAILISSDGLRWDLPAGRPEGAETWEETLRREVREEACATVEASRLLGFIRGRCTRGPEEGLVLVRSLWLAHVALHPWHPLHEILHRRLVPARQIIEHLTIEAGYLPLYRRALEEAGISCG